MKKKIVAGLMLTTVLCMALGGCGSNAANENSDVSEAVVPGAETSSTETVSGTDEADNGVVDCVVRRG